MASNNTHLFDAAALHDGGVRVTTGAAMAATAVLVAAALPSAGCLPPSIGANMLLHPPRHPPPEPPTIPYETVDLPGDGITLRAWIFRTSEKRRGTVIYLHGLGDNRASGFFYARHYGRLGFDVVAYDSRAHGESGGKDCTYGYYEKRDLARVLDKLGPAAAPVAVLGNSMGAAIALQAAGDDARIAAVIAVSPISDLRTAVFERAPFFASRRNIEDGFALAESEAHFRIDDVSPVASAARIRCPVLLLAGQADRETPPAHSERVFHALAGPKRLISVPNAGHHDVLNMHTLIDVDAWLDEALLARGKNN